MYHVYILKSKVDNSLYIGYTGDIERRLSEHNRGFVKYTKKHMPWTVVYYESYVSLEDAKSRERGLKYYGRAFGQLKSRIKHSLTK
ncbi:MAG: GIY-YIG nuclease family protein [Candidatus Omnitrophica bacterium]|nr:GIY-YIG nuclease family protein [Candidatus Omnitrophota bacterium]